MLQDTEIQETIMLAQSKNAKVCAFGTGFIGQNSGWKLLNLFHITISFYCDNNPSRWGNEIKDGIFCINPQELFGISDSVICFILIGDENSYDMEELKKQLLGYGIKRMITYAELCSSEFVLSRFYQNDSAWSYWSPKEYGAEDGDSTENRFWHRHMQINSERIAIYTCITDDYDDVHESKWNPETCDFYIISSRKPEGLKNEKWLDVRETVPQYIEDTVVQSRYCKMNGHKIFSEYRYSIYIDGGIQVLRDISNSVVLTGKLGIVLGRQRSWTDVYVEGMRMALKGRISIQSVRKQLMRYKKEGMPRNFGQFLCGIIVRDHANDQGNRIMEQWYEEFLKEPVRDQLSFPYILWKNHLDATMIHTVNVLDNHYFIRHPHRRLNCYDI